MNINLEKSDYLLKLKPHDILSIVTTSAIFSQDLDHQYQIEYDMCKRARTGLGQVRKGKILK